MVPAFLRAGRVHRPLSSATARHDAPGPGVQVRRRASPDVGAVHRQVDRRREQEHGGPGGSREAAQGQGPRRGRGTAEAHPRGQREGQESLNPVVWGRGETATAEDLKSSVRKDLQVRLLPPLPSSSLQPPADLRAAQFAAYSYLLGMYLGDGYICRTPRTYRFHVSLHQRQGRVIERVAQAITALRPGRPVGFRRRGAVTIVNAYSNAWSVLFPQHGAGRSISGQSSSNRGSGASWSSSPPSFSGDASSQTVADIGASWGAATILPTRSRITRRTSSAVRLGLRTHRRAPSTRHPSHDLDRETCRRRDARQHRRRQP